MFAYSGESKFQGSRGTLVGRYWKRSPPARLPARPPVPRASRVNRASCRRMTVASARSRPLTTASAWAKVAYQLSWLSRTAGQRQRLPRATSATWRRMRSTSGASSLSAARAWYAVCSASITSAWKTSCRSRLSGPACQPRPGPAQTGGLVKKRTIATARASSRAAP